MRKKRFLQLGRLLAMLLGISLMVPAAAAVSLASFSPVGEVPDARQVRLQFNTPLQAFGDAQVDAPAVIACKNQDRIKGDGRWLNGQEWIYEFEQGLPPGVRCRVDIRPEFNSRFGPIQGALGFSFNTGAPRILNFQPWPGSQIEEDQHFLLELSGPIAAASLAAKAWCEVQGLGERLPLRLLSGAQRDAVLKLRAIPLLQQERYLLLSCQRPLPAQARVRLVFDAGIAAAQDTSLRTRAPQRVDYQVRAPLTAEFSCERERATAACMPIRPLLLRFSEPVAAAIAKKARLHAVDGRAIAPIEPSGADELAQTEVSELRFPTPLPPHSSFTLVLPDGLRDGSGRALANAGSFPLKVSTGALPPLAKFAAAPFGVLEYTASEPALLALTLRHLQSELASAAGSGAGTLRSQRLDEDVQVLQAYQRLQLWHEAQLSARELGLPREQ